MAQPPFFADFGKSATDALNDDFSLDLKGECKKNYNGLELTTTVTKKSGKAAVPVLFGLTGKYQLNKNAKLTVKAYSDFKVTGETAIEGLVPNLLVKVEGGLDGSLKSNVEYRDHKVAVTGNVDASKCTIVNGSVAVGNGNLAFGAKGTINVCAPGVPAGLAAGAQYNGNDMIIAGSYALDDSALNVSVARRFSSTLLGALSVTHVLGSKQGCRCTAGVVHNLDANTLVKAKANCCGILSVLYSQRIRERTTLRITGEVPVLSLDRSGSDIKYGLTVVHN